MIAVFGGLAAAVAWAGSSLCSSRSSRLTDPLSVVAGMMLIGLLICAPIMAIQGVPAGLHGEAWLWLVLSGGCNIAGLLLTYAAFRTGQVALITPLVSTEGAVAALIAVAAGETLGAAAAGALTLATVGVCLASSRPSETAVPGPARPAPGVSRSVLPEPAYRDAGRPGLTGHVKVVALALAAALLFGAGLYTTARAGALLPSDWVVSAPRVVASVVLALPLVVMRRLRFPRAAVPFIVASGLCEVAGFFAYTLASRHGIAVAAVLSAQFSTVTVIAAYLLFGERLGHLQLAGVCAVIVGVSLLSAVTA